MSSSVYFEAPDFILPIHVPPGWYKSRITSVEFRTDAQGQYVFVVSHSVSNIAPGCNYIADTFILDGRPHAVRLARRRLVHLYNVCGLYPQRGDEILPEDLNQARLEVQVDYEQYLGVPRLQIMAYRPRSDLNVMSLA